MREDELHLDDIVETELDDLSSSFKIKQDAMESGRIELQKLCQPQLQFSMSMANIYALPEFEPIIHQFQLGKVIKVCLRPDYIKQSRLLQVDINFDDFSDFQCEFGELTTLRTQSDIHADLLSNAISAGKSVATNSSYWTRGSDTATAVDLKIQQGLLDATTQIKAIDGTQGVVIDKYGIKLQKVDPSTGEIDPHQTWMTNNMILMSDDAFKTSRSGIGEFTINEETFYGIIADAVLAGYIEGSKIVGCDINIGNGAFVVDGATGSVTMGGGDYVAYDIKGYATTGELEVLNNKVDNFKDDNTVVNIYSLNGLTFHKDITQIELLISINTPNVQESDLTVSWDYYDDQSDDWVNVGIGSTLLVNKTDPYVSSTIRASVSYDGATYYDYVALSSENMVYTSQPTQYADGDIWILKDGEYCGSYGPGSILKAIVTSTTFNELHWVDTMSDITSMKSNIGQYFEFNTTSGLIIKQGDKKFYVNLNADEMVFYDNQDAQNPNQRVVSIGNRSATIKNAIMQGSARFDCDTTFNQQVDMRGSTLDGNSVGYTWVVEPSNGSFSLSIAT